MSDSKAQYSEFCHNGYVPLHFQPWWLDAVCGPGQWGAALALGENDRVIGAMPYYIARRWGLKVIQLPPLTTYAGPWLRYPQDVDFKDVSRLAFEKKVMGELIAQLPRTAFFKQNFRPEITNWLPFYWKKFRQTTRYTYIFEETNDLEKISTGFKKSLRSGLKKAARWTNAHRDDDAWEIVFALNKRALQRRNRLQPYTFEVFKNLHTALRQRNQVACFVANDKATGKPSAGLYLIFDARQAGVLITGTEPEFKSQCAVYSLFLEAIRFCSAQSLSLDFEGSMDEQLEHALRAFGAPLVPYHQVWKLF